MKFRKTFSAALITLAWAGLVASALAQQQGVTDTEILVADVGPFSGPPALLGLAHNIGVKLAVVEVNASGGINGRKVRLITEDDGYVVSRTLQSVRKLVTVDKVFALTSLSGTAHGQAALPLVKQFGIPTISTMSFADDLFSPTVKNVYTIGTKHALVAEQLTRALAERYPGKKWAIVTQDDEFGELTREGFEKVQKSMALDVVSIAVYKKGQVDFSSEMLRVKERGAEVLFAGGIITENTAMVKELDRLGVNIPVGITYHSRTPVTLKLMGSGSERVHTLDYVVAEESEKGRAFIGKAKSLLSAEDFQRVNRFTNTGYAGARVMFEAFRRCGKSLTWDCTIAQLDGLKGYETDVMSSPVTFSPSSHLSLQKLVLLKANPAALNFKMVD